MEILILILPRSSTSLQEKTEMDIPHWSPIRELVEGAKLRPKHIVIRYHGAGIGGTSAQLLDKVFSLRNDLRNSLPEYTLSKIRDGEDVFICVLVPPGCEFVVSLLVIFALGAAICTMCESHLSAVAFQV
jgi:hypothetical protein